MPEIPNDWRLQLDTPEFKSIQRLLHANIAHLTEEYRDQVLQLPISARELLLHSHHRNIIPKLGKKEAEEQHGVIDICVEGYVRTRKNNMSDQVPVAKYESFAANRSIMESVFRSTTAYEKSSVLQVVYGRRQEQLRQLISNTINGYNTHNLDRLRWRLDTLRDSYERMVRKMLYA